MMKCITLGRRWVLCCAIAIFIGVGSAHAQTCVAQGDGTTWGACNSGGAPRYVPRPVYVPPAPVYRGPSPAELAKQRRIAAGNAANNRGIAAVNRNDWPAALRNFEEARRLWPEDRNVNGDYWNARGMVALFPPVSSDDASAINQVKEAIDDFNKALTFFSGEAERTTILSRIRMGKTFILTVQLAEAQNRGDWDSVVRYARERASLDPAGFGDEVRFALGGQALSHQNWAAAAEELHEYYRQLLDKVRDVADVTGPPDPRVLAALKADQDATAALAANDPTTAQHDFENAGRLEGEAVAAAKEAKARGAKSTGVSVFTNPELNGPLISELTQQIARQDNAKSQQQEAGSSAYEQAKEAKLHGDMAASGGYVTAKIQASMPFDTPGAHQGGDDAVHFQKTPDTSANMYKMGGSFTDEMMTKLEHAPGGEQLIQDEYTWRDKLRDSQDRIADIKSKLSAAQGDQKEQLMEAWTKELNAQPAINQKLNEIEQKARQVVTETVHQ